MTRPLSPDTIGEDILSHGGDPNQLLPSCGACGGSRWTFEEEHNGQIHVRCCHCLRIIILGKDKE